MRMNEEEALKIAIDFMNYHAIGVKFIVSDYSVSKIRMALDHFSSSDGNQQWYKAMEKFAEELD